MLREGSGEPLVLLHGILCTSNVWDEVVPRLAPHYDTVALDALGHRYGPVPARRPVGMEDMLDAAEAQLDALGLERPHLAGFSMGGRMAIDLARRGRARSVCALSPSGCWESGGDPAGREGLRTGVRDARRSRSMLPLLLRSKRARAYAVRLSANHGGRLSRERLLARVDDTLACTIVDDLLGADEPMEALDPAPCPITIGWAEDDRVLPRTTNGERAQQLVPQARYLVLEDVGHVAMFDDPGLVADTIKEACR
jgi:pimeloyl-ACP methyl ester carboxylesterase